MHVLSKLLKKTYVIIVNVESLKVNKRKRGVFFFLCGHSPPISGLISMTLIRKPSDGAEPVSIHLTEVFMSVFSPAKGQTFKRQCIPDALSISKQ